MGRCRVDCPGEPVPLTSTLSTGGNASEILLGLVTISSDDGRPLTPSVVFTENPRPFVVMSLSICLIRPSVNDFDPGGGGGGAGPLGLRFKLAAGRFRSGVRDFVTVVGGACGCSCSVATCKGSHRMIPEEDRND